MEVEKAARMLPTSGKSQKDENEKKRKASVIIERRKSIGNLAKKLKDVVDYHDLDNDMVIT